MTVEAAKLLCIKAHRGQWRSPRLATTAEAASDSAQEIDPETFILKDGSKLIFDERGIATIAAPYHTHPIAVAAMMSTDEEKIAALLHDVIEDTNWFLYTSVATCVPYICKSANEVYQIPADVYYALEALTKEKGGQYKLYIRNIMLFRIAKKVKIADIVHNISDNPTNRQKLKYYSAMKILLSNS